MTSPPEDITVECPKCGHTYEDWIRRSVNLRLDNFDSDYLERCFSATCPKCHHKVNLDETPFDYKEDFDKYEITPGPQPLPAWQAEFLEEDDSDDDQ